MNRSSAVLRSSTGFCIAWSLCVCCESRALAPAPASDAGAAPWLVRGASLVVLFHCSAAGTSWSSAGCFPHGGWEAFGARGLTMLMQPYVIAPPPCDASSPRCFAWRLISTQPHAGVDHPSGRLHATAASCPGLCSLSRLLPACPPRAPPRPSRRHPRDQDPRTSHARNQAARIGPPRIVSGITTFAGIPEHVTQRVAGIQPLRRSAFATVKVQCAV